MGKAPIRPPTFYVDGKGAFRFRIVAPNGENVHGSEGYASPSNSKRAAVGLARNVVQSIIAGGLATVEEVNGWAVEARCG